MCQGEPFGIARLGYVEDLPAVTPTALYTTYQELLESSALHIYIVGPVDEQMVKETCSREFGRFMNDQFAEHLITTVSSADLSRQMSDKTERVVIEEMEVSQGKLNVGLRAQSSYEKDDYPALVVYNGILGGFPHSKLFINVREKSSLAYYASSRLEGLKGLLFIQSGIQMSNFERAKDIIKQQLEDMRKGLITDDELNFTKKGLINQYLQSDDQPFTGAVLQMYSRFTGRERSVTQLIEDVRKVTKEDVVAVAQGITSELVYFLRDKEVSQDESQDL
nr:pitrilysin family protein [Sulfoacidibacillus ferrooxidans]